MYIYIYIYTASPLSLFFFMDNICDIRKYSKRIRFLLCIIVVFSKYTCVLQLEDENEEKSVSAEQFLRTLKKKNI